MKAFPLRWLLLAASLSLALATACGNHRQVITENGGVHFVDADCYSRMTRVRAVSERPGEIIREHRFENYPFGTRPHTTVPFDYAIYALSLGLKPWCGARALDLAGAWISPLLGLAMIFLVWLWADRARLPARPFVLLILAASPIVAHGFELGRPDHQSLILLCMATALSAEWQIWRESSRGWGIVSGVAWALGLWTSLYEPAILLALTLVAGWLWNRSALFRRDRMPGLAVGGGVLGVALLIEGWRIFTAPPGFGEGVAAEYFAAWSRQIGELASVPPWAPSLYAWTGFGLLAAPVLLLLNRGPEKGLARAHAFLLLVVFALTCWQVRWGYFLPLMYALSLPWQVAPIPARWRPVAAAVLLLGFWPVASEWWTRLHPAPAVVERLAEQRADAALLHEVATFIRQNTASTPALADDAPAGILAPWWLSPALAYWSGEPALAGSSHESLSGTVDVARFYTTADPSTAAAILRRRRVRWVVAYEPDRVLRTAAALLGLTKISTRAPGFVLYQRPDAAPLFLRLVMANPYFKIYEVQVGFLPHE